MLLLHELNRKPKSKGVNLIQSIISASWGAEQSGEMENGSEGANERYSVEEERCVQMGVRSRTMVAEDKDSIFHRFYDVF